MAVEISTLENGLQVVSDDMSHLETVSLGVWVEAGARHEAENEHGIAHLLEHMAFKGTDTRSARQIAEEIEAAGGDLNASTTLEYTSYFARVLKGDAGLALEVIADILRVPVFKKSELELEREVILQEIGTARDTPDDYVFDLFQEVAYPKQPLGRPIMGTEESLARHKPARLKAFRKRHYSPDRMILSAAGAIDHKTLVKLAKRHFSDFERHETPALTPARYQGGEVRDKRRLEQVHLVLGFEGVSYHDEDFYTGQVLANILGGGMSSRLFQEVRETRGLVYDIDAFSQGYADSGIFGVYAGTGAGSLRDLVPMIADEIGGISEKVYDDEIVRARAQLKAGFMVSLESSSARAEQMARQLMNFGRVFTRDEILSRVDAVDARAVSALAGRIIAAGKLTLAASGPVSGLEAYDKLTARFA